MELFNYVFEKMVVKNLDFRIGDIVKVIDFGRSYSDCTAINKAFLGIKDNVFYNSSKGRKFRSDKTLFKIKDVKLHPYDNTEIICYIIDREKKGLIIGSDGIRVVKQFPLRNKEKKNIVIKRIKI